MSLSERWSRDAHCTPSSRTYILRPVPTTRKGSRQLAAGDLTLRVIPRLRRKGRTTMSASTEVPSGQERDTADLATLPLAFIPALNGLGWHSLNGGSLHTQLVVALITLVVITVLNIYGVRLVAIINNN